MDEESDKADGDNEDDAEDDDDTGFLRGPVPLGELCAGALGQEGDGSLDVGGGVVDSLVDGRHLDGDFFPTERLSVNWFETTMRFTISYDGF